MAETKKIYPQLAIENNKKPNRWLAFPLLGIMVKIVILIPVFIELAILYFVSTIILFINWFIILFTGKYWDSAYSLFIGIMRLETKVRFYLFGITDKYPGFNFETKGILELNIEKPQKPNRWLAIPFIGILIRAILLIPYFIFVDVISRGAGVAMVLSWFVVLFKGIFPESFYEFEKDSLRVDIAYSAYIYGLSDEYPSFSISMNHQSVKIALIIVGAILAVFNFFGQIGSTVERVNQVSNSKYQYKNTPKSNYNYYNTY